MEFDLERVPDWARNWCYYFAAIAAMAVISGFSALFMGKKLGTGLMIFSIVGALVQAATAMTMFWMCRSSLREPRLVAQMSH